MSVENLVPSSFLYPTATASGSLTDGSSSLRHRERFSDVDVAVAYRSATAHQRQGGDFYGVVPFGDGGVTLFVGDVCGKGAAKASEAEEVSRLLHMLLAHDPDPVKGVQKLNTLLCHRLTAGAPTTFRAPFVTLTLAMIYPPYSQCWFVRAGGEAALLLHPSGKYTEIIGQYDQGSLPVGIRADETYSHITLPIYSGDTILLFTDGVTEARRKRAFFGIDGILNAARSPSGRWQCDAGVLAGQVFDHIADFCDYTCTDDSCLIAASLR